MPFLSVRLTVHSRLDRAVHRARQRLPLIRRQCRHVDVERHVHGVQFRSPFAPVRRDGDAELRVLADPPGDQLFGGHRAAARGRDLQQLGGRERPFGARPAQLDLRAPVVAPHERVRRPSR